MTQVKCSNDDCKYKSSCLNRYYSKLIGDDGYYYCRQCSIDKELFEEQQIKMIINTYDYYLEHKTDKHYDNKDNIPLSLDQVVKRKYLYKYIKNQIPKLKETIMKDDKEYFLIEKSDLYELEVLLWQKHIIFNKLIEKRQNIIQKQSIIELEEEIEERIKRNEEYKEEVKERPNKDRVRRKKKEVEISIASKEEKLAKYKKEQLPEGYTKKEIKKCDYCKNHYCHPFEFMIGEKQEERRKAWKGIICDYCIEAKETEKEAKRVDCVCGGSYYNITDDYERRHHNSKKHTDWYKAYKLNNMKMKEYYTYKMADLRKLVIKNNEAIGKTIIDDYYNLKKADLLKALIELDKQKLLPIISINLEC